MFLRLGPSINRGGDGNDKPLNSCFELDIFKVQRPPILFSPFDYCHLLRLLLEAKTLRRNVSSATYTIQATLPVINSVTSRKGKYGL